MGADAGERKALAKDLSIVSFQNSLMPALRRTEVEEALRGVQCVFSKFLMACRGQKVNA